jgi:NodT family efflux transporter outer membrane factor (OMF) lipoprotein
MSRAAGAAALAALLAAGCRVGPAYAEPEAGLPAQWSEETAPAPLDADLRWWRSFGDATLDGLVERAMAANPGLEVARARVREARALRDAVAGTTYPSVGARAGAARSDASDNGSIPTAGPSDQYQVGFDASWELDLFGRLSSAVAAAEAGLGAAQEEAQAALVSLCGEVAREYVVLRGTQRELAILRSNLRTQRETLELTRARQQGGFSPELDTVRAEAQVAGTAALIPAFEARARASIHALGVLLGEPPAALLELLGPEGAIPEAPGQIGTGLPAEVVRQRPDVRAAERVLARETALNAQATAELYPRVTLFASVGQESARLSDLLDAGSTAWALGGSVLAPIFEGGRLQANVRAQEARVEQAASAWKATVLDALREVEDALSALAREREREAELRAAVDASRRAVQLASDLNAQGLADFFEVLEAQRTLLSAESQLAESQTAVSAQAVALYKALGGAPAAPES